MRGSGLQLLATAVKDKEGNEGFNNNAKHMLFFFKAETKERRPANAAAFHM